MYPCPRASPCHCSKAAQTEGLPSRGRPPPPAAVSGWQRQPSAQGAGGGAGGRGWGLALPAQYCPRRCDGTAARASRSRHPVRPRPTRPLSEGSPPCARPAAGPARGPLHANALRRVFLLATGGGPACETPEHGHVPLDRPGHDAARGQEEPEQLEPAVPLVPVATALRAGARPRGLRL